VYRYAVGRRIRRLARPIDRIVMGVVMGVIVFGLERIIVRSTRKSGKQKGAA
jgi:hypothetical protein